MMAAMKNVLSPISESKIMPHDFKKPCEAKGRADIKVPIEWHCVYIKLNEADLGHLLQEPRADQSGTSD